MEITSRIVANCEGKGRLKAIATVCLDGAFLVAGVRIVDCEKGLAVFMPSRKMEDGSYKDICFPITPEMHRKIEDMVLEVYTNQPQSGNEPTPYPMNCRRANSTDK